ncbi:Polyketide cyclase / dehydrase and lipid transport [Paenibacillus sp. yr247]|uniref:SRPBCC family protein n=1 Tax=Paenibacillus sp. yr247 TaxID=1761880 RepID=UPI00087FFAE7|nr:SRPBCC family protein [Paenibacillus sp. yr247]SDN41436.1 Polyketide cyclase / dehydrase and lipid transport [Paenibacillus sp. yr247]
MVDVLTEITINCPRDKVSDYAANPDHAPEWYVNIHSAVWQTPKPLKVGSKVAFKAAFLGKQLSYVYQMAEYIPGKKLVMRTADGPFPMETTYTWEIAEGNSTRMTLRNKGNPTGFSMLFAPFMSLMMKRANNKDLKKIKFLLEKSS